MSAIPRSSNKAIHDALRVLAREIQSEDGVANVAIAEGADRISELGNEVERLERENAALREDYHRLRRLAYDMAEEMEQHGGEQAFDSLARYRAEMGKEGKP